MTTPPQQSPQNTRPTRQVLKPAHSIFKADVFLEEKDGVKSVVKDYSRAPAFVRATFGRFVLQREIRTLQKLSNITGAPKLIGRVSYYAYRMEYIDGSAPSREIMGTTEGLLEQLSRIVEQMHRVGVTHNDLRTDNLILNNDNQLFLIDFGAVFYRPKSARFYAQPAHWFFNYLTQTDRSKVARIKHEYRPSELSAEDRELIDKTQFARKTTRWWKNYVLPIISPGKHRKSK